MSEGVPDNLEEEVKQIIFKVIGKKIDKLDADTNFYKDLGVDSIKAIEITVAIERKFKVSIRDEQITQIANVGEAVKVLKDALAKKQEADIK